MRALSGRLDRLESNYTPPEERGSSVVIEADAGEPDAVVDARIEALIGRPLRAADHALVIVRPADWSDDDAAA